MFNAVYDIHILNKVSFVVSNFHTLSTKHITWSYKHWIAKLFANGNSLNCSEHCFAFWSCKVKRRKHIVKHLSVFCCINIFWLSTNDCVTSITYRFCKFDCCLSTKLNHNTNWLFNGKYIQSFLNSQWLKI